MSAVLQLPTVWGADSSPAPWAQVAGKPETRHQPSPTAKPHEGAPGRKPDASLAFYRRHTEKMLRRYLYASMQVGRAPSILGDPIGRGWVSSRPVRTFEDAMIFVLDVETCLKGLRSLDREMLCRIVIQEHTQTETAS